MLRKQYYTIELKDVKINLIALLKNFEFPHFLMAKAWNSAWLWGKVDKRK